MLVCLYFDILRLGAINIGDGSTDGIHEMCASSLEGPKAASGAHPELVGYEDTTTCLSSRRANNEDTKNIDALRYNLNILLYVQKQYPNEKNKLQ